MDDTSRAHKKVAVRINAMKYGLALRNISEVLQSASYVDTIVILKV